MEDRFSAFHHGLDPAERAVIIDEGMVAGLLDRLEINHTVDEDGDVLAPWDDLRVYFGFREEGADRMFSVRTFYDRRYDEGLRRRLLAAVDDWNRRTLWPKVYTHTFDDGTISCVGEIFLHAGFGVLRSHFEHSLERWIAASLEFEAKLLDRVGEGERGTC
ncbi:YbjN domain-containing protein [Phytomonospora sp. NPDC050363]|uniref:YbjN domain-containing protein n=1 Tax=Phytomonospora sp. NPDC050363 TaxID=3155642 RepID=UPI0033F85C52